MSNQNKDYARPGKGKRNRIPLKESNQNNLVLNISNIVHYFVIEQTYKTTAEINIDIIDKMSSRMYCFD